MLRHFFIVCFCRLLIHDGAFGGSRDNFTHYADNVSAIKGIMDAVLRHVGRCHFRRFPDYMSSNDEAGLASGFGVGFLAHQS